MTVVHHFVLSLPLFALVALGYAAVSASRRALRDGRWATLPHRAGRGLTAVVFAVVLPAKLFSMMSDLSRLPPVDARLLVAFFGSCLLVFGVGRVVGKWLFDLDGTAQSVFALGGVFSNNVMMGIPLAQAMLGDAALPAVALVLVFNALTLWTLVTVSVEWARHGSLSLPGIGKVVRSVLTNPIVVAIAIGSAVGLSGLVLPEVVRAPIGWIAATATPLALIALGMGLAEHGLGAGWRESVAITALKLVVQPLVVWLLAWMLGLPPLETRVVVLLGSLAVGVNVYLMARQFQALEGAVATSLMLSTVAAALTTPVFLALTG